MFQTPLDITCHFQNAPKLCWGKQRCVGRKTEGRLHNFSWVRQHAMVLSGILEFFPPFTIHIGLPVMRSLTFFWCCWLSQKLQKSKCPSVTIILPHFGALNNILELRFRFLENGSCTWTPCSTYLSAKQKSFWYHCCPRKTDVASLALWSVHVSFGLNLGQIGGSEPKILGSCHPQTDHWVVVVRDRLMWAYLNLAHRQPTLLLTNKQTQTLVRRLRLSFFTSSPLL